MRSPSSRRIGGSPTTCPQHEPRAIRWYSITRWAPGITIAAISRDGGASATHGELSSKSKYTAPVRRTERSTSDRTSADMPARVRAGRLGIPFGRRGRSFAHLDGLPSESDARAWLQHHISHSVDVPRNAAWLVSEGSAQ